MGFQCNLCVTYPINGNIAITVSDSQQKYVALKAMRRSGGISQDLLMKNWNKKCTFHFE